MFRMFFVIVAVIVTAVPASAQYYDYGYPDDGYYSYGEAGGCYQGYPQYEQQYPQGYSYAGYDGGYGGQYGNGYHQSQPYGYGYNDSYLQQFYSRDAARTQRYLQQGYTAEGGFLLPPGYRQQYGAW